MKTENISGKTILVTGSTDGLGKLLAEHLAAQDAVMILHGRDRVKGEAVRKEITRRTSNHNVHYYNGDYSALRDVALLGDEILKHHDHIDILINNVGIGRGSRENHRREVSRDGIELRFAVNYLAHVLLTRILSPALINNSSQIINVASVGQESIDFDNLMLEREYDGFRAYKQSKTALIMYTIDLAGELKWTGIRVNAVHPASLMNTKMVMDDWGYTLSTVEEGAEAVEYAISSETTGAYYDGKRISRAIAQVYDPEARQKLRNVTDELLKEYLQLTVLTT